MLHDDDQRNEDFQCNALALQHIAVSFEWLQHCFNIPTPCCAKNRPCESSRVTLPLEEITKSKGLSDFSQRERKLCVNMSLTQLSMSSREAVDASYSQVFDIVTTRCRQAHVLDDLSRLMYGALSSYSDIKSHLFYGMALASQIVRTNLNLTLVSFCSKISLS